VSIFFPKENKMEPALKVSEKFRNSVFSLSVWRISFVGTGNVLFSRNGETRHYRKIEPLNSSEKNLL
jgi:hypothetical protein